MKKLIVLCACLCSTIIMLGQVNRLDTSFYSEALQETKMVDVYLPPGYDENPDLFYPVIYWLHGWTQDQDDMAGQILNLTQFMIEEGTIEPVIMVCADNSPDPFDGSMYMNSVIWGNYEDYMVKDLLNWVESSFRAAPSRDYRALLGISMGGYGVFRYGILYKDKFKVMAATAIQGLNINDSLEEVNRQDILEQNQPGPPYFYDYNSSGSTTMFYFLLGGAWTPNLNSPQTYIDPRIINWPLDENGDFIDSTCNKFKDNLIDRFIDQLLPGDSTGILFGCGKADEKIYPGHIAFKSTLDSLGLDYEFYDHDGGHFMPLGFKKRALVFIDSLLMPPVAHFGVSDHVSITELASLKTFPNPSSDMVTIQFEVLCEGPVELSLWSSMGQKVEVLMEGVKKSGHYQTTYDISYLPPGIYFCRLKVGNRSVTRKIIKIQ